MEQNMTIEIKAYNFINRKLRDYQKRIYSLLWSDNPKKKRTPNEEHQFDGGAWW